MTCCFVNIPRRFLGKLKIYKDIIFVCFFIYIYFYFGLIYKYETIFRSRQIIRDLIVNVYYFDWLLWFYLILLSFLLDFYFLRYQRINGKKVKKKEILSIDSLITPYFINWIRILELQKFLDNTFVKMS